MIAAAAMLLLFGAPHRAAALICGDGQLDPLEECDDGNLLPGECCSRAVIDPATKIGWRRRGTNTWQYKSGSQAPPGGIERVILKDDPDEAGHIRFSIVGRNGRYPAPAEALVTLSLGFAGPLAPAGQCPQIRYNDGGVGPRCLYTNGSTRFVCR